VLPQLIQPQESISQRLRTHIQPPGPPGLFWITLICSISKQDTKNRRFRHILGVNPLRFYTRSVPLSWDNNFAAYNVSIRCSVRELFKKRRFPPNRRYRPIAFTNPFALHTFSTRICKATLIAFIGASVPTLFAIFYLKSSILDTILCGPYLTQFPSNSHHFGLVGFP
jgi:hypothetical protein